MTFSFNPSEKPHSLGQHFIVGLCGTSLDEWDKRILGGLRPAGILLLKRNFDHTLPYREWLEKLSLLQADIKNYVERDDIIFSLDHEGGKVHRTPKPITHFPAAQKYSAYAAKVAKCMAIELKSLGVNLSWAPLADIHSNPKNPIIGERAFASTPEKVAEVACDFARALQSNGVLGCAKHFPGHGDTSVDSHLELPSLNLNKQQLIERELQPFKALIGMEIPFIMTAHILFPHIDASCPATLSNTILTEILRGLFDYRGIVVSDDLDMKAVSREFKSEENIGRAMSAGCDMFIVARNPDPKTDRPLTLAKYLYRCLNSKVCSEKVLHSSCDRINKLFKNQLKHYNPELLPETVLDEHRLFAEALEKGRAHDFA